MLGEKKYNTINELRQHQNYHWCASELELNQTVRIYGGVMAKNGTLAHVGQYIAFIDSDYDEV